MSETAGSAALPTDVLMGELERQCAQVVREARPDLQRLSEDIHFAPDLQRRDQAIRALYGLAFSLGLHRAKVSESRGGLGLNTRARTILIEELSRADAGLAEALGATWNHSALLERLGGSVMGQKYLQPFLADESGRWLLAGAVTEPDIGSDANNLPLNVTLKTTLRQEGEGYVLNGAKWMTTNAGSAPLFSVVAQRAGTQGYSGRVRVLVEANAEGVEVHPIHKAGLRSVRSGTLTFTEVRVPKEHLLPQPAMSPELARVAMSYAQAAMGTLVAASCVGVAQTALELALAHARDRIQGGKPIIEHQAIALRLAELHDAVAAARATTWQAAALEDATSGASTLGFSARAVAIEAARESLKLAQSIVGSPAVEAHHPLAKLGADLSILALTGGSQDTFRVLFPIQG